MSRRWMMYRSQFERGALLTAISANSAPTDIALSASSVSESASVGSAIATISGTDPNGDTLTYSKVADPDNVFSVSGTQLLLAATLSYATAASHSVTIRATDTGGLTYDATFTIAVTLAANALTLNSDVLTLNGGELTLN